MSKPSNLEALRCHINPFVEIYLRSTHIIFKADFLFSLNNTYGYKNAEEMIQKPLEDYYFALSRRIVAQIPDQEAEYANTLISVFPKRKRAWVKSYNIKTRIPIEGICMRGLIAIPRFTYFKTQSAGYEHAMREIINTIKAPTTTSFEYACNLTAINLERITPGMNSALIGPHEVVQG